jgi:hypothetical protein
MFSVPIVTSHPKAFNLVAWIAFVFVSLCSVLALSTGRQQQRGRLLEARKPFGGFDLYHSGTPCSIGVVW